MKDKHFQCTLTSQKHQVVMMVALVVQLCLDQCLAEKKGMPRLTRWLTLELMMMNQSVKVTAAGQRKK